MTYPDTTIGDCPVCGRRYQSYMREPVGRLFSKLLSPRYTFYPCGDRTRMASEPEYRPIRGLP